MKEKSYKTNLVVLKGSRVPQKAGDIFTLKIGHSYLFGRVINPSIKLMSWDGCLVYIYRPASSSSKSIPPLDKNDLLLPPTILDPACWRCGYAQTKFNTPLSPEEILPVHCFWDVVRERYVDEHCRPLPVKSEPYGIYGLTPFRGLDDKLSKALGIPLAPDA